MRRAPSTFDGRDVELEGEPGRVLRARVLVALVATELLLHVGRRLEDRRDDGAGGWIWFLTGMDTDGREAGVCREFHQGHLSVRGAGLAGNDARVGLYDSLLSFGFQLAWPAGDSRTRPHRPGAGRRSRVSRCRQTTRGRTARNLLLEFLARAALHHRRRSQSHRRVHPDFGEVPSFLRVRARRRPSVWRSPSSSSSRDSSFSCRGACSGASAAS